MGLDRYEELSQQNAEILRSLKGDKSLGHVGIVEQLNDLRKKQSENHDRLMGRVDELETSRKQERWMMRGWIAGAGAMGAFGSWLAKAFTSHSN
jgi:hypothetical protein